MLIKYKKPETIEDLRKRLYIIIANPEADKDLTKETLELCIEALKRYEVLERDYKQATEDIENLISRWENEHLRCNFCIHHNKERGTYDCQSGDCIFEYGHCETE